MARDTLANLRAEDVKCVPRTLANLCAEDVVGVPRTLANLRAEDVVGVPRTQAVRACGHDGSGERGGSARC